MYKFLVTPEKLLTRVRGFDIFYGNLAFIVRGRNPRQAPPSAHHLSLEIRVPKKKELSAARLDCVSHAHTHTYLEELAQQYFPLPQKSATEDIIDVRKQTA